MESRLKICIEASKKKFAIEYSD